MTETSLLKIDHLCVLFYLSARLEELPKFYGYFTSIGMLSHDSLSTRKKRMIIDNIDSNTVCKSFCM